MWKNECNLTNQLNKCFPHLCKLTIPPSPANTSPSLSHSIIKPIQDAAAPGNVITWLVSGEIYSNGVKNRTSTVAGFFG